MDEQTLLARIELWRARAETAATPFEQAANHRMADHYEQLLDRRTASAAEGEAGEEA